MPNGTGLECADNAEDDDSNNRGGDGGVLGACRALGKRDKYIQ